MAAVRSRLPLYLGAGAVGIGGYYMYRAGGRPTLAEKEAERKCGSVLGSCRTWHSFCDERSITHTRQFLYSVNSGLEKLTFTFSL